MDMPVRAVGVRRWGETVPRTEDFYFYLFASSRNGCEAMGEDGA